MLVFAAKVFLSHQTALLGVMLGTRSACCLHYRLGGVIDSVLFTPLFSSGIYPINGVNIKRCGRAILVGRTVAFMLTSGMFALFSVEKNPENNKQ